jgi:hypothetical protein
MIGEKWEPVFAKGLCVKEEHDRRKVGTGSRQKIMLQQEVGSAVAIGT